MSCSSCSPPTSKKILSKIAYNDFINSLPVILDKGVRETQYLVTDELRNRMKRILSYFLIVDDIEDGARSRNGQPCWHLLEDVGSLASNDASMLRSFIMQLLNINFSSDLFVDFAKLFNENDFTDYYDSEEQTGKTGSDIQEGKCTWLAVTALQRCSTAQREEFIANYGSWQPDHVARIRDIYHQLGIIDIYYREEQTTYDRIINKIESLPANSMLSADFFKTVVDAYYPNVACGKSRPPQKQKKILPQEAYNSFINSLPVIIDNGVQQTKYLETDELRDRMKRIAEYYLRGRKTIQGELTILGHELLKSEKIEGDLNNQQYVLAWCVELLMSYILILDDIEDGARSRNGQPCWHLLEDVGSLASNDASMLRSFIMQLLNINFSSQLFVDFAKLFNEAFFTCNVGQYLDAITSKQRNYKNFTMDYYKNIALYKYAYYSVKFPILSALVLSNKYNKETCRYVDDILTDVGIWSQINNDFTDYYDDDEQTGKTGSDIQEGKCTWLAVTALQRCSPTQREEFVANYGSWQPDHVTRIRDIYQQLGIVGIYYREERSTYDRILKKIESLPANAVPSADFFKTVVETYYPNVACGKSFIRNN
ncbi:Farnesyl pyrophosphate synthase 2 [Papilio xuthus]|uniref:Farnesyl pyrophosphate synthase 2 n=1 Tax=Papilio xuthus TaxID=66420 RepID=A0A194QL77_PAPXU|nr:Farnesyl pyrophosphate synthase 2 [Papilio xuthus]